jgi:hypothetical protein
MHKRTLILLSALLGACSWRGCVTEEKVVLLYRGRLTVEPQASVMLNDDKEPAGFVGEVLKADDGLQRIILRLKSASLIHRRDRFQIRPDAQKRNGVRVVSGGGEPLRDGDEIEAEPRRREGMQSLGAAQGVTLPSGIYVPYPAALSDTPFANAREARGRQERRQIDRMVKIHREQFAHANPALVDEVDRINKDLQGKTLAEAYELVRARREALESRFRQEEMSLREKADFRAAAEVRALQKEVDRSERMLERQVEREKRMGGERHYPRGARPPQ